MFFFFFSVTARLSEYKSIFSTTTLPGSSVAQWLSYGNCKHKVRVAVGSVPARTETYKRLRAIWPGVRSASSPSIPLAYSLYHGPSNLMLGELGISVLVPGLCLLFFNSKINQTWLKTIFFASIWLRTRFKIFSSCACSDMANPAHCVGGVGRGVSRGVSMECQWRLDILRDLRQRNRRESGGFYELILSRT